MDCKIQFEKFISDFNKSYVTEVEMSSKQRVFCDNLQKIAQLNAEDNNVTYEINQFADLTEIEFSVQLARGFKLNPDDETKYNSISLPLSATIDSSQFTGVDYRDCYVSVRDQGQCGSCWAFATASSLQGALCKQSGVKKVELAPQELVDCDNNQFGCNGASNLEEPFSFIAKQHQGRLCLEKDYPYSAANGVCKSSELKCDETDPSSSPDATNVRDNNGLDKSWKHKSLKGAIDFSGSKAEEIMEALEKHGPMSIGIGVTTPFQFYKSGVMGRWKCGWSPLNHAVTLVGYEMDENEKPAFRIMNSWGPRWGEEGHIRVSWGACGFGKMMIAPVMLDEEESIETVEPTDNTMRLHFETEEVLKLNEEFDLGEYHEFRM